jgi:CarD family transcriptional regulator
MSSVKKLEKSRKAKARIAKAAAKSRGVKTAKREAEPSAGKARVAPRSGRAALKSAAKRAKSTKATARKSTSVGPGKAAATSAARARLKKLTGARNAAANVSTRKSVAGASAKSRAKTAQASRVAKQAAGRGKTRSGVTAAQSKLRKTVRPVESQNESSAAAKKLVSDRRARAEAVMALRALTGKPGAASHPRKEEANQKVQKKVTEVAPQPPRLGFPMARNGAPRGAPIVQAPPPAGAIKPASSIKLGFKPNEFIVYPAHGVGQIVAVEEQEVAGFKLELFVISFAKDKMILKVPTPKTVSVGMRKLAGADVVKHALGTLTGRARIKRTMWSRRAQEYEAKINSGDLVAIAEVVRDLYRSEAQPEQSYSERQLYEAALDRVAREIAVVHKLTETESLKLIESQLQKGPRRGKAEEADGNAGAGETEEGGIEEAA